MKLTTPLKNAMLSFGICIGLAAVAYGVVVYSKKDDKVNASGKEKWKTKKA